MANVLKCNGDPMVGADADIEWAVSGSHATVYATFEVYITTADLTNLVTDHGSQIAFIGEIGAAGGTNDFHLQDIGSTGTANGVVDDLMPSPTGGLTGSTWHTVGWSLVPNGGTLHQVVDGTDDTSTFTGFSEGDVTYVKVGAMLHVDRPIYIRSFKLGTTPAGSDLLDYTVATDGDPATFGFTVTGDVTTVADPSGGSTGPEGVSVSFGSDALDATPTWTRIDDPDGIDVVQRWTTHRGRVYITDRTEAGTGTVDFIDTDGVLDPTNTTGPFTPMNPNCPMAYCIWHPYELAWYTVYTGLVQNMPQTLDLSENFITGQINAADMFSLLAIDEIPPGLDFDNGSTGTSSANTIGETTYAATDVQSRLKAVLADAGVPSGLTDIFTGNVDVQFVTYPPGTQVLAVLQDTADAEFPGVANLYCDKTNRIVFHGRLSRFDPVGTASGTDWVYTEWNAGDLGDVAMNAGHATISGMSFDRDVEKVVNAARCAPDNIDNPSTVPGVSDIPGQLSTDAGSITQYGNRTYAAENLLTLAGHEMVVLNALEETKLFSNYFTDNLAGAQNRVSQLTFSGFLGATQPTWDIICKVDIGDRVNVTTTHPGGGGFNAEPCYVEGITYEATPSGHTAVANVTMTLDLSPVAFFNTSPFS